MADTLLNLILNIKKTGKGDKEAATGISSVQKATKNMLKNVKQDAKLVGGTITAVTKLLGDAFELAAKEAEKLGRTEVTAQMKAMDTAFKSLTDTLVQIPIGGQDFLGWMGDAAEGAANLSKLVSIGAIAFAQMTGDITDSEAAMKAALLVQGPLVLTTEQQAQAQRDLKDPLDETNRGLRDQVTAEEAAFTATQNATQAAYDKQVAFEKLTGPVSDLAFGMGELTKVTIFNTAAQGLSAEAAYALAQSMGLIDPAAAAAKTTLDELRKQHDDGKLSTYEYTRQVTLLGEAVTNIPEGKEITIDVLQRYFTQHFSGPQNAEGQTATGGGRAGGGPVSADVPYMVGEYGPEMFVPGSSGTIIPNSQTTNNNTWGPITVVVQGANVRQVLENLGRKADTRSRI